MFGKIKSLVERIGFNIDVAKVKESIKSDLGKEYRINSDVTVKEALNEIWTDLDVGLFGANFDYAKQRVKVVQTAINKLGLHDIDNQKVCDYLPQKYLQRTN